MILLLKFEISSDPLHTTFFPLEYLYVQTLWNKHYFNTPFIFYEHCAMNNLKRVKAQSKSLLGFVRWTLWINDTGSIIINNMRDYFLRDSHGALETFIWHQKQTVTLAVGCGEAFVMFLLPTAYIKCQFGKWCRCFTFIVITNIILFICLPICLSN